MKKLFLATFALFAIFLMSCNNKKTTASATTNSAAAPPGDFYFDFTVDGKPMQINADDITSSYYPGSKTNTFKIFAGKEGEPTLMLVIPHDMTAPSVTPSGSPDYDMEITQGSASLQNYPEKNFTSNSYSTTYTEKTPLISDAITITSTDKDGEDGRIIAGTFNTKTYDVNSTDPKYASHTIVGKFRIKHTFSSTNGGKF